MYIYTLPAEVTTLGNSRKEYYRTHSTDKYWIAESSLLQRVAHTMTFSLIQSLSLSLNSIEEGTHTHIAGNLLRFTTTLYVVNTKKKNKSSVKRTQMRREESMADFKRVLNG